jgi:rhodanese-related sulfurtransferase
MKDTEISPRELAERRHEVVVLDVREAAELKIASLPGATHIPLAELPARVGELPTDRDIVVLCHAGVRSEHAMHFLHAAGFVRARNLSGGIDAWSRDVDPGVPRY